MQTIQELIASRKTSLEEGSRNPQLSSAHRDQLLNESIYLDIASHGLNEGIIPTLAQWGQFSNMVRTLAMEKDRNGFKVASFILQLTTAANTYYAKAV